MKIGQQIAYIPMHAGGDINHPDVEFGFVTGFNSQGDPFCRYWRKGEIGTLRTTANSECTPIDMVVDHVSVPQTKVDNFIEGNYA
jgi:hypothetical protein